MLKKLLELLLVEFGTKQVLETIAGFTTIVITPQLVRALTGLTNDVNKIKYIRVYRLLSGEGLRESKEWVEQNITEYSVA